MGTTMPVALGAILVLGAGLGAANAQTRMYKCGSNYQDRPCAEQDVQQRFAPTAGKFDVEQVNPDTDRDCARVVSEAMPYWMRMHKGESMDALRAEYDAKPVSKAQKSEMRDLLIAMQGVGGTPTQARSQFESQCMAYKHRKGIPTERDVADARLAGRGTASPAAHVPSDGGEAGYRRAMAEQRRAEAAAARAARAAAR